MSADILHGSPREEIVEEKAVQWTHVGGRVTERGSQGLATEEKLPVLH